MTINFTLTSEEYFLSDRINASALKLINSKTPAHYHASLIEPREETKAMMIGSALHCLVLEPTTFESRYIVAPEGIDRRTKDGKALWADIESSGKIVLKSDEHKQVQNMAISLKNHETAAKLLDKGNPEVTIFTEIDDVPAKCRIDWLRGNVIVDLKTTDDASPAGFAKSVANLGYDIQSAWYLDCAEAEGLVIDSFIFIAVEKAAPYAIGIYELDYPSIEVGRSKYQRALTQYKHCLETGDWFGYSPDIITLELPKWAMREAA